VGLSAFRLLSIETGFMPKLLPQAPCACQQEELGVEEIANKALLR
jgi:hypothetical protein